MRKLFRLFSAFAGFIKRTPQGAEMLLNALDFILSSPLELVVAGNFKNKDTHNMLRR